MREAYSVQNNQRTEGHYKMPSDTDSTQASATAEKMQDLSLDKVREDICLQVYNILILF